MVANSKKKHWGQIMGGTKTTIDDLRAAVKANITATFDITANDKAKVGVDVARNQESVNDSRHCAGIQHTFKLRVNMCIHTHKCAYRHTGKSGSKSDMIGHIAQ